MRLETERLILRNLKYDDLDDFHAYRSDPEICRFQDFEPFSIADSKSFIDSVKALEFGAPGEWFQLGVELKRNNRLVGDIALKPEKEEPRVVEIGATLSIEHRGKGIAIEAFTRVFEHLFSETETHRIFGILDTENTGSLRLTENLGFRREGEFKKSYWDKNLNEWRDEYLYALLKEDW